MTSLNLTGERFGRLTCIRKTNKRAGNHEIVYLCKCDCGNKIEAYTSLLRRGKVRSCGCLLKETRSKNLRSLRDKKEITNGIDLSLFNNRKNKNNTSGFKGVYKHHNGYIARICVKGIHYHGLTRKTKEEAYQDRLDMERDHLPEDKKKG